MKTLKHFSLHKLLCTLQCNSFLVVVSHVGDGEKKKKYLLHAIRRTTVYFPESLYIHAFALY